MKIVILKVKLIELKNEPSNRDIEELIMFIIEKMMRVILAQFFNFKRKKAVAK